jgi:hypothetical protein
MFSSLNQPLMGEARSPKAKAGGLLLPRLCRFLRAGFSRIVTRLVAP